ncbi:MAG: UDP-N-acetylmuramate dehydrogenase [Leptonema sp. (in: bacteria)]
MEIKSNFSLKDRTTFRMNGTTKYWIELSKEEDIIQALEFIKQKNLKYFILGEGSNTVINEYWEGVILHPTTNQLQIQINNTRFSYTLPTQQDYQEFYPITRDENLINAIKQNKKNLSIECIVDSGIHWDSFVYFLLVHEIPGLEVLSGIPGKIGSTPIQNVGAYGEEIKNFLIKVETFDLKTLKKKTFYNDECEFGYRKSFFKRHLNQYYIYKVHLRLNKAKKEIHYKEVKEYFNKLLKDTQKLKEIQKKIQNTLQGTISKTLFHFLILRYCIYQIRRNKGMILEKNDEHSKNLGSFFINPILTEEEFLKFKEKIDSDNSELKIPFFKENKHYKISAAWLLEFSGFPKGHYENGFLISPKHNLCIINIDGNLKNLKEFIKKIQKTVYKKTNILLEPEPIFIDEFI